MQTACLHILFRQILTGLENNKGSIATQIVIAKSFKIELV